MRRGEVFGFLGPNGAGKTTAIRCLLDVVHPDGGTARILGIDAQLNGAAIRARVGYLPGELHLDGNLSPQSQLRYLSDLRGGKTDWGYVRQIAARLDLDLKRPIKNLSKGNKQKVGVVQALMHRPELLLLDEPTMGLDPLMQREVLALVREARAEGATVFLSSHIIGEVEVIAERVGIIRQGRMVEVAETGTLINRAVHNVRVRFKNPVDGAALARVPGVVVLSLDNGRGISLQIAGEMDAKVKALAVHPVKSLEIERPTLEEVFLKYYSAERVEVN